MGRVAPPDVDSQVKTINESKLGADTPYNDPVDVEKTQKKFMTATWQNEKKYQHPPNPLHPMTLLPRIADMLRYKGPNPNNVSGKMPTYSILAQNAFVLPRALLPVALQVISMKVFNYYWPLPLAMFVYAFSLPVFAISTLWHFNKMSAKFGFLDGQAARDEVPDIRLNWTVIGLLLTVTVRPVLGAFMAYDPYEYPSFSLWTPVQIFIYICVLDFWFYWYHRSMHEVDFLWKFHKTHHMTKHPNASLSAFGDTEQDFFDIFVIPFLAITTFPMKFHTWWIATLYILFVEAAGHTGTRIYWCHPVTGIVLRWFDMELILEDHDLHHRQGWKKSTNYGKQTRIWDRVFNSTRPRLEMTPDNVDWGFMGLGDLIPKLTVVE